MATIKQTLQLQVSYINKEIVNILKSQSFKRAFAKLLLEINLKRIDSGYDTQSRKFGGYNRGYNKKKAQENSKEKLTNFASTSNSKKLRLTGNLLSSISIYAVKVVGGKKGLVIKTGYYIKGALQNKKAEGLYSTTGTARGKSKYSKKSWRFLGIATSGRLNKEETQQVNDFISNYVNHDLKINLKIR